MLTAGEIRENLAGAWLVMNGDSAGLERTDTTIEGFWRSFGAFFLILPAYILAVASIRRGIIEAGNICEPLTGMQPVLLVASWIVDWIAFPALLAVAAGSLGLSTRYVPYIVVRNWASVILMALFTVPTMLHLLGVVSADIKSLLHLCLVGVSGYFSYRIARIALGAEAGPAISIVVADFVLSLMIVSLFPVPY